MSASIVHADANQKLLDMLVNQQLISRPDAESVAHDTQGMVVDLPFILDRRKILDERTCAQSLARLCQVPFLESVPLHEISVPHPHLSTTYCETLCMVPYGSLEQFALPKYKVAMTNPFHLFALRNLTGRFTLELSITTSSSIKSALAHLKQLKRNESVDKEVLSLLLGQGWVTQSQIDWAKSQTKINTHTETSPSNGVQDGEGTQK